jgi:xanthine permease XanP
MSDSPTRKPQVFFRGISTIYPGVSTASSELGISVASRFTSRYIGFLFGGVLVVCAFVPMATTAFSLVPIYVIGAVVIYICAFLIMVGITTMLSRMMDTRKVLVIGLSVQFAPYVFEDVPPIFEPVFASSITLATITAIVLNLALRIGIRQEESIVLEPGSAAAREIEAFLRRKGEEWGAREEVIVRAAAVATEVAEGTMGSLTDGPVEVSASFDELNLDLAVRYTGQSLAFPASRPTEEEMLEDDRGFAAFAWYMAGQYADRARSAEEDGRCRAFLHFDHRWAASPGPRRTSVHRQGLSSPRGHPGSGPSSISAHFHCLHVSFFVFFALLSTYYVPYG